MAKKNYIESSSKAVKTDKRFKHVMALTLNPAKNYKEGIIRCITSREGREGRSDQIDRSVLYKVTGKTLTHFEITEPLIMAGQATILKKLGSEKADFIGPEDPDIWIDEKKKLMHVYFTLPLKSEKGVAVHLGHAVGKDLNSLKMTEPVLLENNKRRAKEVCIAPVNSKGFRYNLVESSDTIKDTYYSIVRVALARDMGKGWKFGKIAFHPAEHSLRWIAGHASPGPLFPASFLDIGPGKRVGIINGCEANKKVKGETLLGTFSIGLFIYDYEKGKIDWVSPKPFIQDSQVSKVRAITFASDFVQTSKDEGIIYGHVNDSFVRAYTVTSEAIRKLLPKT